MTIAMWWFVAGVLLLVAGATWLFAGYGLLAGGALCVAAGFALSPNPPNAAGSEDVSK